MSKLLSHISIFVLFVFALTSVVQFHHHDCDGNICIHLTTLDDLVIGVSDMPIKHFADGCAHSSDNDSDDESCSMHLGYYKASEQGDIERPDSPIMIYGIVSVGRLLEINQLISVSVNDAECHDDYIEKIIKSVLAFRAPPIV